MNYRLIYTEYKTHMRIMCVFFKGNTYYCADTSKIYIMNMLNNILKNIMFFCSYFENVYFQLLIQKDQGDLYPYNHHFECAALTLI